MDFLVARDDLRNCRFADGEAPGPADGEALLSVRSFGLTSNNVTYAVFGDAMKYWQFFPAETGWGRLPVWGFAEVAGSRVDGLEEGTRVFGYLPLSTHLLVGPDRVDERGFVDGAPHRAGLPSAYQGYRRSAADPAYDEAREDEQILFWPLFYTSFLIDDFLADEGFFGAEAILLSSASSKTALIAAFLLSQRDGGPALVGLTSPGNVEFVQGTGVYDEVVPYEEIAAMEPRDAAFVDFSGDGGVRGDVHGRFAEGLAHSAAVGMTHWERISAGSSKLPGPTPRFFFAPDRIKKRGADWGVAELETRVASAWPAFAEWTGDWLEVRHDQGPEAVERIYLEVVEGRTDPSVGHVLTLASD